MSGPTKTLRTAPWPDFKGRVVREGDRIAHPDGQCGTVVFLSHELIPGDQWRIQYDGCKELSRLALQIGNKGMAERACCHKTVTKRCDGCPHSCDETKP